MDEDQALAPVGERLRTMRENAKLGLGDIAGRTRIPLRHLEAIERSDYAALPSSTYATGFVRSYARALQADDRALANDLRVELGRAPVVREPQSYEVVDPARLPTKLLAWTAFVLALLVVGGYALWRSSYLGGEPTVADVAPPPATAAPSAAPSPPAPEAAASREVVLTASAPVWVQIRDGDTRLLLKEMAAGERYVVPATATDPRIRTGRPEALAVSVGGQAAPALGEAATTVRDKSLKAEALLGESVAPAAAVDNGTGPAPL